LEHPQIVESALGMVNGGRSQQLTKRAQHNRAQHEVVAMKRTERISPPHGLLNYLNQIPDPRGRQGRRHSHVAMLAAVVCATLQNSPGYEGAAQWVRHQPLEFWHLLGGGDKWPCANAFRYLMMHLPPRQLEQALWRWMNDGLGVQLEEEDLRAVVLDDRAQRGTHAPHARSMSLILAFGKSTSTLSSLIPDDAGTVDGQNSLKVLQEVVLDGRVRGGSGKLSA
jgi:hypothetical protein